VSTEGTIAHVNTVEIKAMYLHFIEQTQGWVAEQQKHAFNYNVNKYENYCIFII